VLLIVHKSLLMLQQRAVCAIKQLGTMPHGLKCSW
jgi:hypothetical protein